MKRVIFKTALILILIEFSFTMTGVRLVQLRDAYPQPSVLPEFQKGICYATWQRDQYTSPFSDLSLKALAETGAEWVAIVTTWYQQDVSSTDISPGENTPSDESLRHAIKTAHSLGLKVMLKPHLDLIDTAGGYWRADIFCDTEEDQVKWFASYKRFILRYARLAEENGVEMLCVGTELSSTTRDAEKWRYIISAVRKTYGGALVYAANWDEYRNVRFWHELDYVGIDAYFPLSEKDNPTKEEIGGAWERWLGELTSWAKSVKRPVIFTEAGYSSTVGAARTPWEEKNPGPADTEIQKICYEALFEALWHRDWFYGVYWWKWNTNRLAGGADNKGFTPQNKPAQKVLSQWYEKEVSRQRRETLDL